MLKDAHGGTAVTESFQLAKTFPMRLYSALPGWARGPRMERDMHHQLVRGLLTEGAQVGDLRDDVSADELAHHCMHALIAGVNLR